MDNAVLSFSATQFKWPHQRKLREAISKRTTVPTTGIRESLPGEISET